MKHVANVNITALILLLVVYGLTTQNWKGAALGTLVMGAMMVWSNWYEAKKPK